MYLIFTPKPPSMVGGSLHMVQENDPKRDFYVVVQLTQNSRVSILNSSVQFGQSSPGGTLQSLGGGGNPPGHPLNSVYTLNQICDCRARFI